MISDFWIGVLFGAFVGGSMGALAMALVVAGSNGDAHIERMIADGEGEGGSLGVGAGVDGDAAGDLVDRSALEASGQK